MVKRNDHKAEKDKMKCRNNKEAKEPNMNGSSTNLSKNVDNIKII